MKIHSIALRVQVAPPIVKRKRHVLILLQDRNHLYILGQKKIYPAGISRMVGGGVEKYESFLNAARRELHEELKLHVQRSDLIELSQVFALITDAQGEVFHFKTTIYFVQVDRQPLFPGDDLDGITRLADPEFLALIQRYRNLPKEIDSTLGFSWYDYGQLYAQVHQVAWESLQSFNSKKRAFI